MKNMLALAGMMAMFDVPLPRRPEVDWTKVEREVEKINQKKSDLSRRERNSVLWAWNRHQEEAKAEGGAE